MRIAILMLGAAALLGACSKGASAEKDYNFVKKNGSAQAICDAADRVVRGYQADRNDQKYKDWRVKQYNDCQAAGREVEPPF